MKRRFSDFVNKDKNITEGFLDDDEKIATSDDFKNSKEEDSSQAVDLNPFPEEDELEEFDSADETSYNDKLDAEELENDLSDLELDKLDTDQEDVEDSGDIATKEDKQETFMNTVVSELKATIANLTAKIEELTDKVEANNSEETEDAGEFGDEEIDISSGEDEFENENGEESNDSGSDEEYEDDSGSGEEYEDDSGSNEESNDEESGSSEESEDEESGSDEDFEGDETKSEAYNAFCKKGKILNSASGSIIGKVMSGKLYELDESFVKVATSKIRQQIELKKKEFKNFKLKGL